MTPTSEATTPAESNDSQSQPAHRTRRKATAPSTQPESASTPELSQPTTGPAGEQTEVRLPAASLLFQTPDPTRARRRRRATSADQPAFASLAESSDEVEEKTERKSSRKKTDVKKSEAKKSDSKKKGTKSSKTAERSASASADEENESAESGQSRQDKPTRSSGKKSTSVRSSRSRSVSRPGDSDDQSLGGPEEDSTESVAHDLEELAAATSGRSLKSSPTRLRKRRDDDGEDLIVDQSEETEDESESTEDDDEESTTRRRRRRGGRGRRSRTRSAQDDSDGESTDESDSSDEDESDEEEYTGSSRRRRRRRSRTRSDSSRDVRDEITALKGSTRLEAKRQRRREGRMAGRRRPIVTEAEFLARRESVDRSMIVREKDGLNQIAVIEDGLLVEHYVARHTQTSMVGNVYIGRVQNVLPSMEAAFVDLGEDRNAVLYAGEVNWDAAGMEGKPRRIEDALKSGDTVLVQVTKDPIGHKGARLTSQITLAGRYLVLVPGGSMTGISRKLPDTERARLKKILKKVVPDNAGVIVRTAAEGATEEQIAQDVQRLSKQWETIDKKAKQVAKGSAKAPVLLKGEPELALRVVRDVFNEDFNKLIVSGDTAWATISEYIGEVSPDLSERLSHWTSKDDVFAAHRVDEQLAKGFDRKVWLPSGGTIVIDRTEAMTVVDVNTGRFTAGGTLEETVTKNNIEAAEEIVRQLRLRDIGGMVVIDFVDMVLESNRDLVLRRLVECLARDRTRHQVTEVTSLGLVQMTRKRVGQGLVEAFSTTCECCNGRGFIVHDAPVENADIDNSVSAQVPPRRKQRQNKKNDVAQDNSANASHSDDVDSSRSRRKNRSRPDRSHNADQRDGENMTDEDDQSSMQRAAVSQTLAQIAAAAEAKKRERLAQESDGDADAQENPAGEHKDFQAGDNRDSDDVPDDALTENTDVVVGESTEFSSRSRSSRSRRSSRGGERSSRRSPSPQSTPSEGEGSEADAPGATSMSDDKENQAEKSVSKKRQLRRSIQAPADNADASMDPATSHDSDAQGHTEREMVAKSVVVTKSAVPRKRRAVRSAKAAPPSVTEPIEVTGKTVPASRAVDEASADSADDNNGTTVLTGGGSALKARTRRRRVVATGKAGIAEAE
ncbi:Rne/Rng family ribonuclease [Actinomyces vulturis]|uniref:Rne/Rng family ribonuclease n=1 Tax=Actinomyces vulturis TaxID=1857645 RepID=UPI0009F3620F|nr:Rne/Rng family ribonuclease [Actinomyces vulturis]